MTISGVCFEQNWMFVDRGEETGGWYWNLYFLGGHRINEWHVTKFVYCLLLNMIFFSFRKLLGKSLIKITKNDNMFHLGSTRFEHGLLFCERKVMKSSS